MEIETLFEITNFMNCNIWKMKMKTWKPLMKIKPLCFLNLIFCESYFCMYSFYDIYVYCWVLGWLSTLTKSRCLLEAREFYFVMSWWCFDLNLLYSTMVMCLVYSMRCIDALIVISFQCSYVKLRWMVWPIWYNLRVFN